MVTVINLIVLMMLREKMKYIKNNDLPALKRAHLHVLGWTSALGGFLL